MERGHSWICLRDPASCIYLLHNHVPSEQMENTSGRFPVGDVTLGWQIVSVVSGPVTLFSFFFLSYSSCCLNVKMILFFDLRSSCDISKASLSMKSFFYEKFLLVYVFSEFRNIRVEGLFWTTAANPMLPKVTTLCSSVHKCVNFFPKPVRLLALSTPVEERLF